jgi:hypothetical protein
MVFILSIAEAAMGGEEGVAYYFDFNVPRMVGIPESQMESYGCTYAVSKEDVERLIRTSPPSSSGAYESKDVRVKMEFKDGHTYYVDSSGVIRDGARYFSGDKEGIAKVIVSGKRIKCRH